MFRNGKLGSESSKTMCRWSVRSLRLRPTSASNPADSSPFKSRFLEPIYLNPVEEDRKWGNLEEKDLEEDLEMASLKNGEKRRTKNKAQNNCPRNDPYYAYPKPQSSLDRHLTQERAISQPDPKRRPKSRSSNVQDALSSSSEAPDISTASKWIYPIRIMLLLTSFPRRSSTPPISHTTNPSEAHACLSERSLQSFHLSAHPGLKAQRSRHVRVTTRPRLQHSPLSPTPPNPPQALPPPAFRSERGHLRHPEFSS